MTDSDATPGDAREASRAADEFRASLERQRQAEDAMSAARAARQEAMAEAVEIVRVAEAMARVIEEAARAAADATLAEATTRSEEVIARAREEIARLVRPEESRTVGTTGAATDVGPSAAARSIQALHETALAEVAAQRRHAQLAFHEQIGATIGRLETMASDVQMVLDRAMAELSESFVPLAELPAGWTPDPPATNGDKAPRTEPWHERWRNLFRPPR
jgi:hypothetical protein